MNRCVGTAWRMFWPKNNKYRSRQLTRGVEIDVECGQFLGQGSGRLWSQVQEGVTSLSHWLFIGRRAVNCRLRLKWEHARVGVESED